MFDDEDARCRQQTKDKPALDRLDVALLVVFAINAVLMGIVYFFPACGAR
jgi:hypothetical protein